MIDLQAHYTFKLANIALERTWHCFLIPSLELTSQASMRICFSSDQLLLVSGQITVFFFVFLAGSNEEDASTQTHDNLPDDSETQHQQQQYDMYSARGSTILSPGSFMSYLKQPGIMLTPINPSEAGGDFSNLPDLLNHSSSLGSKQPNKISNDVRLFKCATCGKDFKQKSTLFQHERIHTDARPYGCNECGKRFRQQSHLTQHLRIHANEKPFACVYCERTFRQRAILNQHLRIHSGEKPFGCIECGKRFRQKAILNQHIRTHQGEQYSLLSPPNSSSFDPSFTNLHINNSVDFSHFLFLSKDARDSSTEVAKHYLPRAREGNNQFAKNFDVNHFLNLKQSPFGSIGPSTKQSKNVDPSHSTAIDQPDLRTPNFLKKEIFLIIYLNLVNQG